MTETVPPALVASAKRSSDRRLVFAAMLAAGVALAVAYVHFAGGGDMPSASQSETASKHGGGTTKDAVARAPSASWLAALRNDLRKCEAESIFAQPFCREKAKFKHCKNRWGSVEECPKADMDEDRPA